jgi:hypothetical protein
MSICLFFFFLSEVEKKTALVYFYGYPILTIDSIEAGNGIMSNSAELKLQLEHVDKLEFKYAKEKQLCEFNNC